jgi:WD40 repeat protein
MWCFILAALIGLAQNATYSLSPIQPGGFMRLNKPSFLALAILLLANTRLLSQFGETCAHETPGPIQNQEPARQDHADQPAPEKPPLRLGSQRLRVNSFIATFALSPDSKTIAVAAGGSRLSLFDAASGELIRTLEAPNVYRLAFSPDGLRLLCGGSAKVEGRMVNVAQEWDVREGKLLHQWEASARILSLHWTSDGQALGIVGKTTISLREFATGKQRFFANQNVFVNRLPEENRVAFTPNGNVLAAAPATGPVLVWETDTGKQLCSLDVPGETVRGLAISREGKSIASLSRSGTQFEVRIWDGTTGKAMRTLSSDQRFPFTVAFLPDGQTLATVGMREIIFWDVATGRELRRTSDAARFARDIAFSGDGKTLVTAEQNVGALRIWDADRAVVKPEPDGHAGDPLTLAFSPDSKHLATGGLDGKLLVWDLQTGAAIKHLQRREWVRACVFSPDSRSLYSSRTDDQLRFSNTSNGHELYSIQLKDLERQDARQIGKHLALSANGLTLVAVSEHRGETPGRGTESAFLVTGWDTATRAQRFERRRPFLNGGTALSPSATLLALVQPDNDPEVRPNGGLGSGRIIVEDTATGRPVMSLPQLPGQTAPMAFSPDGRLLALSNTGVDGRTPNVKVFEIPTVCELVALPNMLFSRVAFSVDNRILATVTKQDSIVLWDLATNRQLRRLSTPAARTVSLAISPDGRKLAAGLTDTTILVWDIAADSESTRLPKLDKSSATQVWAELGSTDATKAFQARCRLAAAPDLALPIIKERLKPAPRLDLDKVQAYIRDLNSTRFEVREKAQNALEALDAAAEKSLRSALTADQSAEARRRIESILTKLGQADRQPDLLQSLRAVAVLEDIGNTDAQWLLERLTKGEPEARLTQAAQQSLQRLQRTRSAGP